MTWNQLNLVWNCTPIYNWNIKGDYDSDVGIVDKYMKDNEFKSYLFIGDVLDGKKKYPTMQVRKLRAFYFYFFSFLWGNYSYLII